MVETIQQIQEAGISVLSSIICGLEPDTVQTIRTMREFALESGTMLAQFTMYHPYPGTKDFYEMVTDLRNLGAPAFVPKHTTKIPEERFWLKPSNEVDLIKHAHMTREELLTENRKCWDAFYSVREVVKRIKRGRVKEWSLAGMLTYLLFCLAFRRIYGGQGMAADGVRRKQLGTTTRVITKVGIAFYNHYFRKQLGGTVGTPMGQAVENTYKPAGKNLPPPFPAKRGISP
jgi:hypothetical protein